jgi:predicted transposase/invertase (TIGR01784 family)
MQDKIADIHRLSHDKAFKQSMQDIQVAKDFFASHLPKMIQKRIDLNTLKPCATEYGQLHEIQLKTSSVDLLFSVDVINQDKTRADGFIQLHCEQQTVAEKFMAWRMLRYTCAVTEDYLLHHPKTDILPVIIPLVLYHHKLKYPYPTDIFALYGNNQDLAREFMFHVFQLIDLSQIPDNEITQHKKAALLEMVMKYITHKNLEQVLSKLTQILDKLDQTNDHHYVLVMLKYLLGCGKAEKVNPILTQLQAHLTPTLRKEVMTIAEHLKQEGIEQGRQEGIQEGTEKGIELEKRLLAKKLLQENLPIATIAKVTDLPVSIIEGLAANDE